MRPVLRGDPLEQGARDGQREARRDQARRRLTHRDRRQPRKHERQPHLMHERPQHGNECGVGEQSDQQDVLRDHRRVDAGASDRIEPGAEAGIIRRGPAPCTEDGQRQCSEIARIQPAEAPDQKRARRPGGAVHRRQGQDCAADHKEQDHRLVASRERCQRRPEQPVLERSRPGAGHAQRGQHMRRHDHARRDAPESIECGNVRGVCVGSGRCAHAPQDRPMVAVIADVRPHARR